MKKQRGSPFWLQSQSKSLELHFADTGWFVLELNAPKVISNFQEFVDDEHYTVAFSWFWWNETSDRLPSETFVHHHSGFFANLVSTYRSLFHDWWSTSSLFGKLTSRSDTEVQWWITPDVLALFETNETSTVLPSFWNQSVNIFTNLTQSLTISALVIDIKQDDGI